MNTDKTVAFLDWLIAMDDVEGVGPEERRRITLTDIIARARVAREELSSEVSRASLPSSWKSYPCIWCGEPMYLCVYEDFGRRMRCVCGVVYSPLFVESSHPEAWQAIRDRKGYTVTREGDSLIVQDLDPGGHSWLLPT